MIRRTLAYVAVMALLVAALFAQAGVLLRAAQV